MEGVTPVEGAAIGWRVVRADRQVVAGLLYFLQIELWTKTRCEVHERKVFQDLQGNYDLMQSDDDLLPCDRSLPKPVFPPPPPPQTPAVAATPQKRGLALRWGQGA